jgi:alpha-glucuronidase
LVLLAPAATAWAETGYDAWLRYPAIKNEKVREQYADFPVVVTVLDDSEIVRAAQDELIRGIRGMLGHTMRVESGAPQQSAVILGTFDAVRTALPSIGNLPDLKEDGYWLKTFKAEGETHVLVAAANDRGVLYGTFALLRMIALEQQIDELNAKDTPYAPLRILNHWDNLDGTIERGYAGKSIFWEDNHVVKDLSRVRDYARLMASIGINGCSLNNVNADVRVITPEVLPHVARVADELRPWGVRLYISLDFASPRKLGGLQTFDPLDPQAIAFWQQKVDEIYRHIPDLGGFVLKADSEGRLGPSEYGRTHADAANVIARALAPHDGVIFYRGFVYDHKMDWNDLKNDRARAAYDNFYQLDGEFDDNVIVQIKHGPIDFQVREPASPLFGALEETNQVIELQITQEYLGQQRHLCFLVPMWKEVLDFDMHALGDESTPVKKLVAGRTFKRPLGGFVGVSNVGLDTNWLGHDLAQANLYGFGRLAWDPNLSSQEIAAQWTRLTFGNDPRVVGMISEMLLKSWNIYEKYTGPLGAGTLTDIIEVHYGPGIESSEDNSWGQWHRADEDGIGMDRTVATGTGFIDQYRPPVARIYESLKTCPDDLLLFMHHVPYTHELRSGKTVIQHIYDSHYQGAAEAAKLVDTWRSLEDRVDQQRYQEVLHRLEYQAGHAQVWRDAICNWFLQKSGIADTKDRVGNYPNRFEAEDMKLDGFEVFDVTPWETASGGKGVQAARVDQPASLSFEYVGEPGLYDLYVRYFDESDGASQFTLFVGDQQVDEWKADENLPTTHPDGHSSSRRVVRGVVLRPADTIRIEAVAQGQELAPIDHVEIEPHKG